MKFLRENIWLLLCICGAFAYMGVMAFHDSRTHTLLKKQFMPTPGEIKIAMLADVDTTVEINKVLESLLTTTKADRAYLFQFHNGTRLLSGKHYYFYSNTHEIVRPGTSSEMSGLQKLPISILTPTWMPQLIRGQPFFQATKDEKHEYSKKILEGQGIAYIIIVPIMDSTGAYPIGFCGVDYVHSTPIPAALRDVQLYADQIGVILWN